MLLLVSPGGFERFTKDLSEPAGMLPSPPDIAKLVAETRHRPKVTRSRQGMTDAVAGIGKQCGITQDL